MKTAFRYKLRPIDVFGREVLNLDETATVCQVCHCLLTTSDTDEHTKWHREQEKRLKKLEQKIT